MKLTEIDISSLEMHPANVRAHRDIQAIERMRENIIAIGLINPLIVTDHTSIEKGKKGSFYVIAGGTRLQALRQIATIDPKTPLKVPCIVSSDHLLLISMSENVVRDDISPVDEYRAFSELAKTMTPQDIAATFNISETRVVQRITLGCLHKSILDDLDAGVIGLAYAMALTLTSDHKRQRALRKEYPENYHNDVIKNILTEKSFNTRAAVFDPALYTGPRTTDLFAKGMDSVGSNDYLENYEEAIALQTKAIKGLEERYTDAGWKWVEILRERAPGGTFADTLYHQTQIRFGDLDYDGKKVTKKDMAKLGVIVWTEQGYCYAKFGVKSREETKLEMKAKRENAKLPADKDIVPGSVDTYSNAFKTDLDAMGIGMLQDALASKAGILQKMLLAHFLAAVHNPYTQDWIDLSIPDKHRSEFVLKQLEEHSGTADLLKAIERLPTPKKEDRELKIYQSLKDVTPVIINQMLAVFISKSVWARPGSKEWAAIAADVELKVRDGWTPDNDFFLRMSKPQIIYILEQLGTPAAHIETSNQLMRSDLVDRMVRIFVAPVEHAEQNAFGKASEKWIAAVNAWVPESFEVKG
jgi:ParB-like chromosome segregation protein Spo0J